MAPSILETLQNREVIGQTEIDLSWYTPLFWGSRTEWEDKRNATSNLLKDVNKKGIKQVSTEIQEISESRWINERIWQRFDQRWDVTYWIDSEFLTWRAIQWFKNLSEISGLWDISKIALEVAFPTPQEKTWWDSIEIPYPDLITWENYKKWDWKSNLLRGLWRMWAGFANMWLHPVKTLKAWATLLDGIEDVAYGRMDTEEAQLMLEIAKEEWWPWWELIKWNPDPIFTKLKEDPVNPISTVLTIVSWWAWTASKLWLLWRWGRLWKAIETTWKIAWKVNPLEQIPNIMLKWAGKWVEFGSWIYGWLTSGLWEGIMRNTIPINKSLKLKLNNIYNTNAPEWLLENRIKGRPNEIIDSINNIWKDSSAKKKKILTTEIINNKGEIVFDPLEKFNSPKARQILKDMTNVIWDLPDEDLPRIIELYAKSQKTPLEATWILNKSIDRLAKSWVDDEIVEGMLTKLARVEDEWIDLWLTLAEMDEIKTLMDKHENIYKVSWEAKQGAKSKAYSDLRKSLRKDIIKKWEERGLYWLDYMNRQTWIARSISKNLLEEEIWGKLWLSTALMLWAGTGTLAIGSGSLLWAIWTLWLAGGVIAMLNNPVLRSKLAINAYRISPKNMNNAIKKIVSRQKLSKSEIDTINKAAKSIWDDFKININDVEAIQNFNPKVTFQESNK